MRGIGRRHGAVDLSKCSAHANFLRVAVDVGLHAARAQPVRKVVVGSGGIVGGDKLAVGVDVGAEPVVVAIQGEELFATWPQQVVRGRGEAVGGNVAPTAHPVPGCPLLTLLRSRLGWRFDLGHQLDRASRLPRLQHCHHIGQRHRRELA